MCARNEIRMFALPADASAICERLLHQRRGIDEYLHVFAGTSGEGRCKLLDLAFEHVVIVTPLRVNRNDGALWVCKRR